ncbi:MAG TPA: FAD-binding oxidoreductase [Candidatus Binatia bacterium]|jgi:sarcosine oxidase subunit beta|nr:FAD-binding oxidoreductase [Candidatus Binatia bacterium]
METAEAVIVGGGIVGASIAWHLTEAGCKNVLIVERETHQGKGSTGKSMGGVRAQFATAPNIQMSMYSIRFYSEFDERLGQPGGYRPQGYLFLATAQKHLDYLRTNQTLQHSLGLTQAQMVSRDDIIVRVPQLRNDDILGGSFCPTDGFVDPYSVMTGFTTCAVERGVRVWRATEVTAIRRDGTGILGVETARGCISTRTVVNAAGAWAAQVATLAGVDLPVEPLRRQLVPTEPFDGVSHEIPMVIDMTNGFHFRPESLGFLLAWNDPEETAGYKTDFEPSFIEKILDRAADRVPCFENLAVNPKRVWAGLYEMSPDHHCILGPVESVPGFFCANGFSGHGVMHAPATGRILADLITTGRTDVVSNVSALSPARFAKGELLHETAVL